MLTKCDQNQIKTLMVQSLNDVCTIFSTSKGAATDYGYADVTTSNKSKCRISSYASPKEIITGAKLKNYYDATIYLPLETEIMESDYIVSKTIKYEIVGIDRGKTNAFLLEIAARKVKD